MFHTGRIIPVDLGPYPAILFILLVVSVYAPNQLLARRGISSDPRICNAYRESPLALEESDDGSKKSRKKKSRAKAVAKKSKSELDPAAIAKKKKKRKRGLAVLRRKILYDASSERSRAIASIRRLKKHEIPPFLKLISELLRKDTDPGVRASSARALGRSTDTSYADALIRALKDESKDVQLETVRAINKLKIQNAGKALFKLLEKQDFASNKPLLTSSINALGKLKYTAAVPFLLKKAKDEKTHIESRQNIVLYFGAVKARDAAPYLMKIVEDDDKPASLRSYSVNSLGKMSYASALPLLRKTLKGLRAEKTRGRESAQNLNIMKMHLLTALIRLGDASVYGDIESATRDDDPYVRARAIRQLGSLKVKRAEALLCYKYLHDASRFVRREARKAMYAMKGIELKR